MRFTQAQSRALKAASRFNQRAIVCYSILMLLALPTGAFSAETPQSPARTPLSQELIADLGKIEFDVLPEQLVRDIHYVASDEAHHFQFKQYLSGLGGVFVGIGTNQNYTMLPWIQPELTVMLDFDQMVVDVHDLYRVAFLAAATPAEFFKFWAPRNKSKVLEAINAQYAADPAMVKRVTAAYKYSRYRILKALRLNRKTQSEAGAASYLTDQEQYSYIVQAFKEGRIIAVRGDLTKDKTMRQLGQLLRKHGRIVRVYHPSNAEQYFPYSKSYRANVRALPIDEKSMVVRTRAWAKYEKLTEAEVQDLKARIASGKKTLKPDAPELQDPPKRKTIYYTYATQSYGDFLGWLADPKIKNVRAMLPYKSRVKDAHYAIKPYPEAKAAK